ncbi:MAG: hypothetical protein COB66_07440 [Coxiella sp. (in: Bacteria)]|nr:MAG: hypothetical protein COB66_07440 [Coxiella sp. (in: g-proteobacteria)]
MAMPENEPQHRLNDKQYIKRNFGMTSLFRDYFKSIYIVHRWSNNLQHYSFPGRLSFSGAIENDYELR